ncbi:hypothetical protein F53441_1233 [Fusarium austroafricanum]|uniref:NACHT-NTPase and P-loop NTPases N-terminal domain-containing protein n=1 Tax=Fusarium austroafricanum TaxID=2364996 RepID=A0A8H4PDI9_9HYPO|nr:hypothetical protein F53441_1233 [Fusarium austroafricanum]
MPTNPRRVETSLEYAIASIRDAIGTSNPIHKSTEAPEAFKVVAKQLPLVRDILTSVKSNFTGHVEEHSQLLQMADKCPSFGRQLDDLLDVVAAGPEDKRPFLERYHAVANDGGTIECVMKKLLLSVGAVVKVPLVTEDQLCELRAALKEIKSTPASMGNAQPGHVFHNHADGIQPIHLGGGGININQGNGPQINTPSGGTFHFAPPVMT